MSAINILAAFECTPPPLDFVLPGFIPGTVGLITAPGGTGKSLLALQASMSVCGTQADLLDLKLRQHGRVLYLCLEDPEGILARRLHAIGKNLNPEARKQVAENMRLEALAGQGADIMEKQWQEGIYKACEKISPRLIVIDTLSRVHRLDENSNSDMAQLISLLEQVATKTKAAVLLLHHSSKSMAVQGRGDEQQSARGASALVDNARWQAFLAGMTKEEGVKYGIDEDSRRRYVRFGISKNNYSEPFADRWLKRADGGVLLPTEISEKRRVREIA